MCLLCCDDTSESWGCDASVPGSSLLDVTGQGFVGGAPTNGTLQGVRIQGGGHNI